MTVGYIIIAHQKPLQLLRLVRTIRAQSEGPIVIHLDRKSADEFEIVIPDLRTTRHVRTISKRRVRWGDFSIVQAALDCMSVLCSEFPNAGHIKHLSGQDYPIKPIAAFEQIMAGRNNLSSMELHRLPWAKLGDDGGMNRVQYTYLRRGPRFSLRLPFKRRLPGGITFHFGSQFWCLSQKHCHYVLADADKWRSLFRRSLIPDETFFQTILMNSVFSNEVVNEELTHSHWEKDAANPSLLSLDDLPQLNQSRFYFARKFDMDRDPHILDVLDLRLGVANLLENNMEQE
jgi:Core-2/I-Branching enzyme